MADFTQTLFFSDGLEMS